MFDMGVQPAQWKIARVVPLHKRGPKSQLKNYRPVSLLSVILNIMETIVNVQLVNYFERFKVISLYWFGFRRGLGTCDLLMSLKHD